MTIQPLTSKELFLTACRNQKTERLPIWLMRQAGRYMQDYRKLREKYDFLAMCKTPELAVEVTLQPIQKFDFDAAILFSDILTPLEPMGIDLQFSDAKGPQIGLQNNSPFTIVPYNPLEKLDYVYKALKILRQDLPHKALLGFSGAPFTLAAYILEGKHRSNFHSIRRAISENPAELKKMLEILAKQMGVYLAEQIIAGADAVQLFDSWAGNLPEDIFNEFSLPYLKLTISTIKEQLAVSEIGKQRILNKDYFVILFIKHYQGDWKHLVESGADILSIDELHPLQKIRSQVCLPLQGNLSPYSLYLPEIQLLENIRSVISSLDKAGHIFNLGHGVLPDISESKIQFLIEQVKSF